MILYTIFLKPVLKVLETKFGQIFLVQTLIRHHTVICLNITAVSEVLKLKESVNENLEVFRLLDPI